MALDTAGQAAWGGGIFRGRNAPSDSFYDAENALINDESLPFRRGGSAYRSGADAGVALEGLWDGYLAGGLRTVFWSETAKDVFTLASDDSTVVVVSSSDFVPRRLARGAVVGGVLFLPGVEVLGVAGLRPIAYGGSRKTSDPALFGGTFTTGSRDVTASGTSFLTTVDAGMIVIGAGGIIIGGTGVVGRVVSDTALELVDAWTGATGTGTTQVTRISFQARILDPNATDPVYVTSAGQRLIAVQGSKVRYSPPGEPFGGDNATNFHPLPGGAVGIGADAIEDTAIAFTTAGVWAVRNMALDPIDGVGNPQHQVEEINKDVILWGDPGIAAWGGVLVVPAVDDVYLFSPNGEANPISAAIRPLYRGYVKAGYQPGIAAVHRGHYHLPILNGTTVVDVLVCRLDREGTPWTRWSDHAAGGAYAQRIGATTRSPKLLGISGQRVTDLSGCYDPSASNAADADGTAHSFKVTSRDYPTSGSNHPGTVSKARLRYELVDDGGETLDFGGVFDAESLVVIGPWLSWIDVPPSVLGGVVVPPVGGYGAVTRPETVGPNCFCEIEFDDEDPVPLGGFDLNEYGLGVRLTSHDGGANGYMLKLDAVGVPRLLKGSALAVVASGAAVATASVTGLRIEAVGPSIRGLVRRASDGEWVVAVTTTDSTYPDAGFVGFWTENLFGTVAGITAFSWGEIPTVALAWSSDREGGVFETLTSPGLEASVLPGGEPSDGSRYSWWNVGKQRERIRFRITQSGPAASFVLRAIELLIRQSGLR